MSDLKAQLTDVQSIELKQNIIDTKSKMYRYELALKSIIEIQTIEADNTSNTATGFLVGIADRIFLVTNKHVISNYNSNDNFSFCQSLRLVFRTKKNILDTLHFEMHGQDKSVKQNIKVHPRNFIDIAAIEITDLLKDSLEYYDISTLDFEQLLESSKFDSLGIVEGKKVVISGYPYGLKMEKNYPISSTLIIGRPFSKDNELFKYDSTVPENERNRINNIAINAVGPSFKGMSGGPLFVLSEDYPKLPINFSYAVIGIFSFGNLLDEKNDTTSFKNVAAFKSNFIVQTLLMFYNYRN